MAEAALSASASPASWPLDAPRSSKPAFRCAAAEHGERDAQAQGTPGRGRSALHPVPHPPAPHAAPMPQSLSDMPQAP